MYLGLSNDNSDKYEIKNSLFHVYECFACVCVSVHRIHAMPAVCKSQKSVPATLEAEFTDGWL